MDFQTLTRRQLQSLCKLNKIPANITNVAMAEALQSLEIVVGIEEFMNVTQSETADLVESVETVVVPSPKAPQTRCRTSTRQKVKPTETENLQSTVTRKTRRGSKQPPKEVEESKNDMLKTPAVSRTSRKVPATTTRRNVNNQLSECKTEVKEEVLVENKYSTRRSTRLTEKKSAAPASRVMKGVENAVKIDSFLDQGNSNAEVEDICDAFEKLDVVVIEEEVYNLKQGSDETSNSFEDNLEISEVNNDEVKPESDGISSPSEEAAHKSGEEDEDGDEVNNLKQDLKDDLKNSEMKNGEVCDLKPEVKNDEKPESDSISSPSEEVAHKSGEEDDEDCDEVNNLKQDLEDELKNSEVKDDEVYDLKPDSDDITSPCEDENLVQKLDLGDNLMSAMKEHNPVIVQEEHSDADDTSNPCEDEDFEVKENNYVMVQEENADSLESGVDAECGHEDTEMNNVIAETNEIITKEMEEMAEDTVDVIPTVDNQSTMTEEVEDLKPETNVVAETNEIITNEMEEMAENTVDETNVTKKSDADSGPVERPLISSDVMGHPTHVTLFKKATPFKNMTEEVEDHKLEYFTENIVNGKKVTPIKNVLSVVTDDKENIVGERKNGKKEKHENENTKSFNGISIRQLKKQLKALTLKNLNSKEEGDVAGTKRPALQAVCENQMVVGGETEN